MSNPILDRIYELAAEGLHPMAVTLTAIEPEQWECRITLQDWCPGQETDGRMPRHTVTVDRDRVPDGVTVYDRQRYPDDLTTVVGSETDIERLIAEVAREGNAQDWARFADEHDRQVPVMYLTKPRAWMK